MNEILKDILAFTIALPAISGVIFYKKIDRPYHPLVSIFLISLFTEITNWIAPDSIALLGVNLYVILNTALHLWFFYNMQIIKRKSTAIWLFALFMMVFFANVFYYHSIYFFASVAACASSTLLLILCIEGITKRVFSGGEVWYQDAFFVFCIINLIYYAYFTFFFTIRFFGLNENDSLGVMVSNAHAWINAASNILLTWVMICIVQTKAKYIKP